MQVFPTPCSPRKTSLYLTWFIMTLAKFGKYGLRSSLGQWRNLDCLRRSFIASSISHLPQEYRVAAKYRVLAAGCLLIGSLYSFLTLLEEPSGGGYGKAGTGTPFASFSTAGGDELARRGGSDRVGARKSLGARRARLRLVEGRPVAHRSDPRRRRLILAGRPAPRSGDAARSAPVKCTKSLSTSGSRSRLGRHKHRVNPST